MVSSMSTFVETAGVSSELVLGEQAQAPPTITTIVETAGVSSEAEVAGAPTPTPPPEAPPPAPPPEAPPEGDRRWLWLAGAGLLALILLIISRRRR